MDEEVGKMKSLINGIEKVIWFAAMHPGFRQQIYNDRVHAIDSGEVMLTKQERSFLLYVSNIELRRSIEAVSVPMGTRDNSFRNIA